MPPRKNTTRRRERWAVTLSLGLVAVALASSATLLSISFSVLRGQVPTPTCVAKLGTTAQWLGAVPIVSEWKMSLKNGYVVRLENCTGVYFQVGGQGVWGIADRPPYPPVMSRQVIEEGVEVYTLQSENPGAESNMTVIFRSSNGLQLTIAPPVIPCEIYERRGTQFIPLPLNVNGREADFYNPHRLRIVLRNCPRPRIEVGRLLGTNLTLDQLPATVRGIAVASSTAANGDIEVNFQASTGLLGASDGTEIYIVPEVPPPYNPNRDQDYWQYFILRSGAMNPYTPPANCNVGIVDNPPLGPYQQHRATPVSYEGELRTGETAVVSATGCPETGAYIGQTLLPTGNSLTSISSATYSGFRVIRSGNTFTITATELAEGTISIQTTMTSVIDVSFRAAGAPPAPVNDPCVCPPQAGVFPRVIAAVFGPPAAGSDCPPCVPDTPVEDPPFTEFPVDFGTSSKGGLLDPTDEDPVPVDFPVDFPGTIEDPNTSSAPSVPVACNNNGIREGIEACDGTQFGTATCADYGNFNAGGLQCANCMIDPLNCRYEPPLVPILNIQQGNSGNPKPGDLITFTITANNTGQAPAFGALTEQLPAGLTFVSALPAPAIPLTWPIALWPGQQQVITVAARLSSSMPVGSVLTAIASVPGFQAGSTTFTVVAPPEPPASSSSTPPVVQCAPVNAACGGQQTCCGTALCAGGRCTLCGNNALDPGEPCDGQLFANNATCQSQNFDGGNLTCTACAIGVAACVQTPVRVERFTANPVAPRPGDVVTYTLVVKNPSVRNGAPASVAIDLPAGLTNLTPAVGYVGRQYRVNLPAFLPGEEKIVVVSGTVPLTARAGNQFTASARVNGVLPSTTATATALDPELGCIQVTVDGKASWDPARPAINPLPVFTFLLNTNPVRTVNTQNGTAVIADLPLQAYVLTQSAQLPQNWRKSAGNNGFQNVNVNQAAAAGQQNCAQVTFSNEEIAPPVTIQKQSPTTVLRPGDTVRYIITLTNTENRVVNVTAKDSFPSHIQLPVTVTDAGGAVVPVNVNGNSITWPASVPANGTVSYTLSVTARDEVTLTFLPALARNTAIVVNGGTASFMHTVDAGTVSSAPVVSSAASRTGGIGGTVGTSSSSRVSSVSSVSVSSVRVSSSSVSSQSSRAQGGSSVSRQSSSVSRTTGSSSVSSQRSTSSALVTSSSVAGTSSSTRSVSSSVVMSSSAPSILTISCDDRTACERITVFTAWNECGERTRNVCRYNFLRDLGNANGALCVRNEAACPGSSSSVGRTGAASTSSTRPSSSASVSGAPPRSACRCVIGAQCRTVNMVNCTPAEIAAFGDACNRAYTEQCGTASSSSLPDRRTAESSSSSSVADSSSSSSTPLHPSAPVTCAACTTLRPTGGSCETQSQSVCRTKQLPPGMMVRFPCEPNPAVCASSSSLSSTSSPSVSSSAAMSSTSSVVFATMWCPRSLTANTNGYLADYNADTDDLAQGGMIMARPPSDTADAAVLRRYFKRGPGTDPAFDVLSDAGLISLLNETARNGFDVCLASKSIALCKVHEGAPGTARCMHVHPTECARDAFTVFATNDLATCCRLLTTDTEKRASGCSAITAD